MTNYNDTLGAPLICTWASTILLTIELSQSIRYFRVYRRDRAWRKACVASCVVFDLVAVLSSYGFIYLCGWWFFRLISIMVCGG